MPTTKQTNRIKMGYKKHDNIIDLEFEFFKDLELNKPKKIKEEYFGNQEEWIKPFENIFSISNGVLCEVLEIINDKVICFGLDFERSRYNNSRYNGTYFSFENTHNLKVGEVLLLKTNEEEDSIINVWRIKDNLMNVETLQKYNEKIVKSNKKFNRYSSNSYLNSEEIINKEFLSKNNVKRAIEKNIRNNLKEFEKEKAEEEERTRKGKEEQEKQDIDFKQKGDCVIGNYEIKGKELIINSWGTKHKFILKKNVNKLFNYSFFKSGYFPQENLITEQEDFTKQIKDNETNEWVTDFKISFEKDKKKQIITELENKKYNPTIKINDIKVRKDKVTFILNRTSKDTTDEEIKLLNTLTGMKADTLKLENIDCADNNFDIDISIINQDKFKINFINQTKNFNWEEIKEHFFDGGSSRSISSWFSKDDMLNFIKIFEITKQDFYNHLKKVVLLKELEKDGGNQK